MTSATGQWVKTKCSAENCSRQAKAGLDGFCLGHYHWLVFQPVQRKFLAVRRKYIEALASTPKQLFEAAVSECKPSNTDKDRDF